jgi:hypothetical protein
VQQFASRGVVAAQRPSHLKGLSHKIDVIFRTENSVCMNAVGFLIFLYFPLMIILFYFILVVLLYSINN